MRVTSQTKAATRTRILAAAQALFARHGFHATTTRDIASEAEIGAGTLFNYFPNKELIVESLVNEAYGAVAAKFADGTEEPRTLEEELFACVAAALRKFAPYRSCLPAILDTVLSPLASSAEGQVRSLRVAHLESVVRIATRHQQQERLTPLALQMYWTLFTGVLAFWATDRSPKQEDTLALLDQSLAMFVGWLTGSDHASERSKSGG